MKHTLSSFSSAPGRNIVCHDYLAILRLDRARVLRRRLQLELLRTSIVEIDFQIVQISVKETH
jgi:hypothetical protein